MLTLTNRVIIHLSKTRLENQKHSIAENTASLKTPHRRKHSIVENTVSSKTQHRRKHSIVENTALPKTQHCQKHSIVHIPVALKNHAYPYYTFVENTTRKIGNTASLKTQHR